jgi:hypothetical protein
VRPRKPKRRVPPVAPRKARRANAGESQRQAGRESAPTEPRLSGQDEVIAERRVRALSLRKSGASYRTIASQLGIDVATAWCDVQAELGALRDQATALAEDVRELELRRLDDWTLAMTPEARKGNVKAVFALVKIQERRARLLGLDAPTKVDHSGQIDLGPAAERIAGLLGEIAAARDTGEVSR